MGGKDITNSRREFNNNTFVLPDGVAVRLEDSKLIFQCAKTQLILDGNGIALKNNMDYLAQNRNENEVHPFNDLNSSTLISPDNVIVTKVNNDGINQKIYSPEGDLIEEQDVDQEGMQLPPNSDEPFSNKDYLKPDGVVNKDKTNPIKPPVVPERPMTLDEVDQIDKLFEGDKKIPSIEENIPDLLSPPDDNENRKSDVKIGPPLDNSETKDKNKELNKHPSQPQILDADSENVIPE